MRHAAALIAFAIAMPFIVPAYASTDAVMKPAAIPVTVLDTGAGDDSRRSLETMRGVIAAVDKRNDRISVQLSPDATADLKVRDGLLFNAVRYGDPVEVTVEDGRRLLSVSSRISDPSGWLQTTQTNFKFKGGASAQGHS